MQIAPPTTQPATDRRFSGLALAEDQDASATAARLNLILTLPPAALP